MSRGTEKKFLRIGRSTPNAALLLGLGVMLSGRSAAAYFDGSIPLTPTGPTSPCAGGVGTGGDTDGDGVCDPVDNCLTVPNLDQADSNKDGIGDACQSTCVTIQRGLNGDAADAYIDKYAAQQNFGADVSGYTGKGSSDLRQFLIRFNLDFLPLGADIQSAKITLRLFNTGTTQVRVHQILAPWAESKVTWDNFNGAYSPNLVTSFSNGTKFPTPIPPTSFDITNVAQKWALKPETNFGVLLDQDPISLTTIRTSEWYQNDRPKLTICYQCPDGADEDKDRVCDSVDNCPIYFNPDQLDSNGDGVGDACQPSCGDGKLHPSEDCDDGNVDNGDGCDASCRREVCGNGILQAGEACDDGNLYAWDGCDASCQPTCLDGDGDHICDSGDNCLDEPNPSQADSDGDGIGDACEQHCVFIRRGTSGTVEDTILSSGAPNANFGMNANLVAGKSGSTTLVSLLRFDLSSIPQNAHIKSADVTLRPLNYHPLILQVRGVTTTWSESKVTWNNFGNGIGDVITNRMLPAYSPPVVFSILEEAQDWIAGTQANNGILIQHKADAYGTYRSSEWSKVPDRPSLDLCYTIPEDVPVPFATYGDIEWYKVPVTGAMTDNNIRAACESLGLSVPCQTSTSCYYNDAYCKPATPESSCGNPMAGLSTAICGSQPGACAALNGVFQYMGTKWSGGCGALNGQWCSAGNVAANQFALCIK